MNEKIRLIALDLDGTLLDDRKEIPADNIRALREAEARGIHIALATGRMTPRIEPIQDRLGVDCAIIAYNGAKVVGLRSEGRPLLHHRPLPADVARCFMDFARRESYLLNFYTDDIMYAEDQANHQRLRDLYTTRTGAEYVLGDLSRFDGVPPTKLIVLADPEEADRLCEKFRKEFAGRASITKSEAEYVEIMAPGVDKGEALPALARYFGISCEEILAVGDADNDAGLIERAGVGVAVANAGEKARLVADAVTKATNNDAGVAEALYRFVLV
jgi:Cof subfamily protein (haloacid dehalogenase superfamily)